ncbi:MAG: hypothetical protein GF400_06975 [Candidatus Eisenbacteria bacterium]|nr:hypothetical protein [Candidatus Eisenbacteria bacterium]
MQRTGPGEGSGRKAPAEVCQLVSQEDALEPLSPLERLLRTAGRKARGLLRRLGVVATHPLDARHAPPWRKPTVPASESRARDDRPPATREGERAVRSEGGGLRAGDLVRVRSLGEIRATLDGHRKLRGLQFLHPMAEHCGKTYRVLKRVRRIVNDVDHTVKKVRNVVILDGVVCHGRGIYGREDCDRTCFFFWKEAWLERVDEPDRADSADSPGAD